VVQGTAVDEHESLAFTRGLVVDLTAADAPSSFVDSTKNNIVTKLIIGKGRSVQFRRHGGSLVSRNSPKLID
jgi:hypothetical protein